MFGKAYDIPAPLRSKGLFPSVCLKNAELRFNFGDSAFDFPPPNGWIGISSCPETNYVENTFKGKSFTVHFYCLYFMVFHRYFGVK